MFESETDIHTQGAQWSQEQFVITVSVQRQFYDLHLVCLFFKFAVCNFKTFSCLQGKN